MKSFCVALCAGLLLCACGGKHKQGAILSKMEMVPIVYQLMLVDEFSQDMKVRDSTLKVDSLHGKKYDQVFHLNEVDYETFKKSYEYYLARPNQLKTIFDSIEALGNRVRVERMNPSSQPATKPTKSDQSKKPVKKPV